MAETKVVFSGIAIQNTVLVEGQDERKEIAEIEWEAGKVLVCDETHYGQYKFVYPWELPKSPPSE